MEIFFPKNIIQLGKIKGQSLKRQLSSYEHLLFLQRT